MPDGIPVLIHDPGFPAVAGYPDGAHLVDILNTEMHAPGACRLAQAVVRVILVIREVLFPSLYQAWGYRLRAYVHHPPLLKLVILKLHVSPLYRVKDILGPRHEQPHDRYLLLRHGPEYPVRLYPTQDDGRAAGKQAPEPVHLRAGVVKRRYAQELALPR